MTALLIKKELITKNTNYIIKYHTAIKPCFSLLLFFILFLSLKVFPQCPNNKINSYTHCCPRFSDKNNNGICDLSELDTNSNSAIHKSDSATHKSKDIIHEPKSVKPVTKHLVYSSQPVKKDTKTLIRNQQNLKLKTLYTDQNPVLINKKVYSAYDLILLSSLTLGFYLLTYFLSKTGIIRKCTHRRIWNVILLLAALLSIFIGFILVILLNYCIRFKYYSTLNLIHIEAGIVLAIITIFHLTWHLKYYKNIFQNKKDKISQC
ncbi:MAG: hypothetical protein KA792_03215 [Bacteroidales bacterium]|nr:hypothetical protein [Bacteroidales bacterium]